MVAMMTKDNGYSILRDSQFSRETVPFISQDMAKSVLGYTLEKKPCYTAEGEAIDGMSYIGRSDGGAIDSSVSVGDRFAITAQPLEVLEFANFVMSKVPNTQIETVATMYNGGTTILNLRQGNEYALRGDDSPMYSNLLLCNPLTRGRFHIVAHSVRVVCMNTLASAMHTGEGYRFSHTVNARLMVENALEVIRGEMLSQSEQQEKFRFLAEKDITSADVNMLMDKLYPLPVIAEGSKTNSLTRMQNLRDEVMNQFETDSSFKTKSYWAFLNANTHLVEHPLHKQSRVDDTQIAYENIIGSRNDAKQKMFSTIWNHANGMVEDAILISA